MLTHGSILAEPSQSARGGQDASLMRHPVGQSGARQSPSRVQCHRQDMVSARGQAKRKREHRARVTFCVCPLTCCWIEQSSDEVGTERGYRKPQKAKPSPVDVSGGREDDRQLQGHRRRALDALPLSPLSSLFHSCPFVPGG